MSFKTSSGTIKSNRLQAKSIEMVSDSGDIEITTADALQEVDLEAMTSTGKIQSKNLATNQITTEGAGKHVKTTDGTGAYKLVIQTESGILY